MRMDYMAQFEAWLAKLAEDLEAAVKPVPVGFAKEVAMDLSTAVKAEAQRVTGATTEEGADPCVQNLVELPHRALASVVVVVMVEVAMKM